MNPHDEGLGLSLLIYLAVMACSLAVVVLPVYFASRPMVIANADSSGRDEPAIFPLRPSQRVFPVARLKDQTIVPAAEVTALNAATKKGERAHAAPVRQARRTPAPRRPPPHNALAEIGAAARPTYPHIQAMF